MTALGLSQCVPRFNIQIEGVPIQIILRFLCLPWTRNARNRAQRVANNPHNAGIAQLLQPRGHAVRASEGGEACALFSTKLYL